MDRPARLQAAAVVAAAAVVLCFCSIGSGKERKGDEGKVEV